MHVVDIHYNFFDGDQLILEDQDFHNRFDRNMKISDIINNIILDIPDGYTFDTYTDIDDNDIPGYQSIKDHLDNTKPHWHDNSFLIKIKCNKVEMVVGGGNKIRKIRKIRERKYKKTRKKSKRRKLKRNSVNNKKYPFAQGILFYKNKKAKGKRITPQIVKKYPSAFSGEEFSHLLKRYKV